MARTQKRSLSDAADRAAPLGLLDDFGYNEITENSADPQTMVLPHVDAEPSSTTDSASEPAVLEGHVRRFTTSAHFDFEDANYSLLGS